ncbi:MAG: BMP family protein [Nocardioides sp.]|uniref:BMP family lipoprotein n=1 Tax=Nocardioides sp. TaxID=35761 RepID=UPI003F0EE847
MKKTARFAAVAVIAAITLAGCGERPSDDDGKADETTTPTKTAEQIDFKACMVSDSGGFDDKSFNQTSHDGLLSAAANIGVQTAEVESHSDSEYGDNIDALVSQGCNSVTTVGFLLGDATLAAAKKNKDVDFSIVDYAYFNEKGKNIAPANLQGLTFNTDEPSFLAGYLAAATTETGTVGTLGGMNIPTVTIFMEGFRLGVEQYNKDSGEKVKLLGWDGKGGSFTDDFEDKTKGQNIAAQMIGQGADIVYPVAGPAGLGALQAAKDADVQAIWVDTDGCVSAAEYCDVLLTSVMKAMDVAVEASIQASVDDSFSNEPYVGTLENGGVGLADIKDGVDQEVLDKIEELKAQIIAGEIKLS